MFKIIFSAKKYIFNKKKIFSTTSPFFLCMKLFPDYKGQDRHCAVSAIFFINSNYPVTRIYKSKLELLWLFLVRIKGWRLIDIIFTFIALFRRKINQLKDNSPFNEKKWQNFDKHINTVNSLKRRKIFFRSLIGENSTKLYKYVRATIFIFLGK